MPNAENALRLGQACVSQGTDAKKLQRRARLARRPLASGGVLNASVRRERYTCDRPNPRRFVALR
jgi:hypothetical protein